MPFYADYTTLSDLRANGQTGGAQIDLATTKDDGFLLSLIRQVSREIDDASAWECFAPVVATRYYDKSPYGRSLIFEDSVALEVTNVLNGAWGNLQGNGIDYDLRPLNFPPYNEIRLRLTSGVVWMVDSTGNYEKATAVTGVWGYHHDYANAWIDTLGTVQNNPLTAAGTSLTVQTGKIKAGMLLKLGSGNDFAYASAVTTGGTDTVTLVRGVNGSTAVQHAQGELIYAWTPGAEIEALCRRAVQGYYKLRSNPVGETVNVDGVTFQTPKDVNAYIVQTIAGLGANRPY